MYNKNAGALGADFGAGEVTLNLTVGSVEVDGTYAENFLAIADFEMSIRGNVFNNYHCAIARGVAATACVGTFTYAGTYLPALNANVSTSAQVGSARLIAGGAFYGDKAQEAAGGIAHLFGTDGTRGMRLQFLAARPEAGGFVHSLSVAAVSAVLPVLEAELPDYAIGNPPAQNFANPNRVTVGTDVAGEVIGGEGPDIQGVRLGADRFPVASGGNIPVDIRGNTFGRGGYKIFEVVNANAVINATVQSGIVAFAVTGASSVHAAKPVSIISNFRSPARSPRKSSLRPPR